MDKLEKALGLADYTLLTFPLTEETYHLIRRRNSNH